MTLIASLFPLLCYFAYGLVIPLVERRRPSLSVIMSIERRRWVANAARRESPFDVILAGNLMGSVSFMASTSALMVLAVLAVFGQIPALMGALEAITPGFNRTAGEIVVQLVVILTMFVLAFFAFTLSLRQFNHFCILLGALAHDAPCTSEKLDAVAQLNTLGARNFNSGIRAYYFSVATVAWFAAEWLAIAASLAMILILVHREFFSTAHRLAASSAVITARRDGSP